jgi:hypothetical protein
MPKLSLTDNFYQRTDIELKKTIIQCWITCVLRGSCNRYFSANCELKLNKIRDMALLSSAVLELKSIISTAKEPLKPLISEIASVYSEITLLSVTNEFMLLVGIL